MGLEGLLWIMQNLGAADPTEANILALQAAEKYCDFHRGLFGKYDFHVQDLSLLILVSLIKKLLLAHEEAFP